MGKAEQNKVRNPDPRSYKTTILILVVSITNLGSSCSCNYDNVHQEFSKDLKCCFFPQLLQKPCFHHSFNLWCSSFWHFHHKLFNDIGFQSNALTLKSCWCHLPDVHVYWIKMFICFISNYKNTWGVLDVIPYVIQRPVCPVRNQTKLFFMV